MEERQGNKYDVLLTITSLLSILLLTFHLADDIVRGFEKGNVSNLAAVPIFVVWLYGTLVLAKRRSDRAPNEDAARFALRVDVIHDGRSAHATLVGGPQADAAAAGASATVRALMEDEVSEPGVWMPEQVISPPGFFSRLCEQGLAVELSTIDDHPRACHVTRVPFD